MLFSSRRYLNVYKKYADLLNNKADQDVSAFLREPHSIQAFKQVAVTFAISVSCHHQSFNWPCLPYHYQQQQQQSHELSFFFKFIIVVIIIIIIIINVISCLTGQVICYFSSSSWSSTSSVPWLAMLSEGHDGHLNSLSFSFDSVFSCLEQAWYSAQSVHALFDIDVVRCVSSATSRCFFNFHIVVYDRPLEQMTDKWEILLLDQNHSHNTILLPSDK